MKYLIYYVTSIVLLYVPSFAQTPDTLWTKTYGGINTEECNCIIQTMDSGFALGGFTSSYGQGQEDMYLVRTNNKGDTVWTKTFGGSGSEGCNSLIQTPDGGFLLAGWTDSFGAGNNGFLVKTNSIGDTIWTRVFNNVLYQSGFGGISSVIKTDDGKYSLACGYLNPNNSLYPYLLKIDINGDTVWTKKYKIKDSILSFCTSHIQTSINGYAMAGISVNSAPNSPDFNENAFVIITDINGDTTWTRIFDNNKNDEFWSIVEGKDGNYSLVGDIQISGTYYFWQLCLDNTGKLLWSKSYGNENCNCRSHIITSDGGYILAGRKTGSSDVPFYIIKTNSMGNELWELSYGGSSPEFCKSVIQTFDFGYVLAGYTESFGAGDRDFLMIRLDTDPAVPVELSSFNGFIINKNVHLVWHTQSEKNNYGFNIERSKDSNWKTIGFIKGKGTTTKPQSYEFVDDLLDIELETSILNYQLKQIDTDGSFEYSQVLTVNLKTSQSHLLLQNYPNPFNSSTRIYYSIPKSDFVILKVYDLLGREIQTLVNEFQKANAYSVNFEINGFSSGIYFYELQVGNDFVETKKMMFLH